MLKENTIKIFEKSFIDNWELPALSDYNEGTTLTYGEFAQHIAQIHLFYEHCGVKPGDKVALIGKKTVFSGEAVPFVMELPNYRLPGLKNVVMLMWDKAKDFLQRAFTVIFLGTIAVWFLKNFDPGFNLVTDSENSILAVLAGVIAPLFAPLGFGDWKTVTSLISGFLAKESVVSMLTVLYGGTEGLRSSMSGLTAFVFLVFCLLYTPCVAAIASVKQESGGKAAVVTVVFQCLIAWIVAFIVRMIGLAIGAI